MKGRTSLIQAVFIIWAAIVSLRLGYWQIFKSAELKKQAAFQYGRSLSIPSPRGEIKSSDGFPLVTNQESYLVYVNPRLLPNNPALLRSLTEILPASESAKRLLNDPDNSRLAWLPLSRQVDYKLRQTLEALNIPGMGFEVEPVRSYPEGSPSAYFTGFVGKNDMGESQGYFGLEGYYNRQLNGKTGMIVQQRDAFNRPILIGGETRISPQPGDSLITSIDRTIQLIAYQKLEEGLKKYQAVSGTVSIMETKTGRVLAMVSLPSYDPATFTEFSTDLYKNPLISDAYEPGSTFKSIIMGSALDAGAVRPETICEICSGPTTISGETVGSWNNQYHPGSNMTEVILHSDNVGMVYVSRRLGKARMLEYVRRFGFGKPTGIDMQEESSPALRPDDEWQEIDWATAAFGQGIAVTPIQMLTAVNAIANRGRLVPPSVVTRIESANSNKDIPPRKSTQVISSVAAAEVTKMMINGVQKGEVRYYRPEGYLIAGKTGTAQVPIEGHYDKNKTIASFVGFAPADDARFTMLVTLREPKTSPWGSTTAAPLWFDISKEIFRYYRIPPQ